MPFPRIFYSPNADGGTVISTEQMEETLASLDQAISAYENAKKLFEHAGEQLCSKWTGEGGNQFQKHFTSLQLAISDELEDLQHIRVRLSNGKALYEGADSSSASLFHSGCSVPKENQHTRTAIGSGL